MRGHGNGLWLDLRHSVRRLRQATGLSLTIILTIVMVLVANIAIFSLLNVIVLRKAEA